MEAKYYKDKESHFFYKILNESRFIKITNFKHIFGIENIENPFIIEDVIEECIVIDNDTFVKVYFTVLNKLNKTFVKLGKKFILKSRMLSGKSKKSFKNLHL